MHPGSGWKYDFSERPLDGELFALCLPLGLSRQGCSEEAATQFWNVVESVVPISEPLTREVNRSRSATSVC